MEFALIIFKQTLLMGLYMLIGYLLYRGNKIDAAGSRSLAALLVWASIPATILKSCLVPYSSERLAQMGQSFLFGAVAVAAAMLIARLCYRRDPIAQFAAAFSNAGFIGIPLVQASLGDEAVFFLIGIIVLVNVLQFSYGVRLLKGGELRLNVSGILLNPITLAGLVGVALFACGLGGAVPPLCSGLISGVAALNAPLAMIVLGVYLAQTRLDRLVTCGKLYLFSAVRLLLIPCLTVPLLALLPGEAALKMAVMIAAAAPAGANVAIYAQLYGCDYAYACETVTQSTVLSIVTLPLVTALAGLLIR